MSQVLSHVGEGLISIMNDKPEDPIGFLSRFLRDRGGRLEGEAYKAAMTKFYDALNEAEEFDRGDGDLY